MLSVMAFVLRRWSAGSGLLWGAVTATVTALAVSAVFANFEGNLGTHIFLFFVWLPSSHSLDSFF